MTPVEGLRDVHLTVSSVARPKSNLIQNEPLVPRGCEVLAPVESTSTHPVKSLKVAVMADELMAETR